MNGAAEIARKLHRPGRVEPELMAKRLALGFGHRLADDLAQRIAERRAHGKGDDEDRQHDEQGLGETARDEGGACGNRFHGRSRGKRRHDRGRERP